LADMVATKLISASESWKNNPEKNVV